MVYFIEEQGTGFIKVGMSSDPLRRMEKLQVSTPHALLLLGTVHGGMVQERMIHEKFRRFRAKGEWFHGGMDGILQQVHDLIENEPKRTPFLHPSLLDQSNRRNKSTDNLKSVRVADGKPYRLWIIDGIRSNEIEPFSVSLSSLDEFIESKGPSGRWVSSDQVFLVGSWPIPEPELGRYRVSRKESKIRVRPDVSFWSIANTYFGDRERKQYNKWRSELGLAWFAMKDAIDELTETRSSEKLFDKLQELKDVIEDAPDLMSE